MLNVVVYASCKLSLTLSKIALSLSITKVSFVMFMAPF